MFPLQDDVPSRSVPLVTWGLIFVNCLVFIRELALPQQQLEEVVLSLGLVPARLGTDELSWLTLLTCMFLHGSWMHLLGNMWSLYLFGDNVEDRFGSLGVTGRLDPAT